MAKSLVEAGWEDREQFEQYRSAYNKRFPTRPIGPRSYDELAKRLRYRETLYEVKAAGAGWATYKDYERFMKKGPDRRKVYKRKAEKNQFEAARRVYEEKLQDDIIFKPKWEGSTKAQQQRTYRKYKEVVDNWDYTANKKYDVKNIPYYDENPEAAYYLHSQVFTQLSFANGVLPYKPTREEALSFARIWYVDILGLFGGGVSAADWDAADYLTPRREFNKRRRTG